MCFIRVFWYLVKQRTVSNTSFVSNFKVMITIFVMFNARTKDRQCK